MPLSLLNRMRTWTCLSLPAAIIAIICLPAISRSTPIANRQPPSEPDLQVEFLGSEKGYAVGGQSVAILCVIRNAGTGALPENTARVRCYPLAGLDFLEGQLWPNLPALNAGQAVAYRWRLAVTNQTTPLVFSVLITKVDPPAPAAMAVRSGGPQVVQPAPDIPIASRAVAVAVPRFPSTPHLLGAAANWTSPHASVGSQTARVGNDRSLLNVVAAQDRVPLLVLAGKEGNDWKVVATTIPSLQVRSAEEGQQPWWESFRWMDTDVRETKDSAILTLHGRVGPNLGAQIILESRANTGVIYGTIRLTAKRNVRLFGLHLPRLLAVPAGGAAATKLDGSAAILNVASSPLADQDRLAAAHTGALTFGLTWPVSPPFNSWRSSRMAYGDVDHLPILGAEWSADARGDVLSAGASIEAPFRLFVFGPSDTVKDAVRFRIP